MIAGKIKIFFAIAAVLAAAGAGTFAFGGSRLHAQASEPAMLITWHAETYVPPEYTGKAMPVANSRVNLVVDMVDGGKVVDLSSYPVIWYLNDNLLDGGRGLTHTTLTVPPDMAESALLNMRVEIPDYRGGLLKTIRLPVGSPQASIEVPFQNNEAQSLSFTAKAHAYFFNAASASQLNFAWTLNGESPQTRENPAVLNVNISSQNVLPGTRFTLGLAIRNPNTDSESAFQSTSLTFSP